MDAATLYMVTTLANGEQRTSTKEFSNLPRVGCKPIGFDGVSLISRNHLETLADPKFFNGG